MNLTIFTGAVAADPEGLRTVGMDVEDDRLEVIEPHDTVTMMGCPHARSETETGDNRQGRSGTRRSGRLALSPSLRERDDQIMMNDDWHDGGWGPGAWIAMALMMLAFWAIVAALVIAVMRSLARTRSEAPVEAVPHSGGVQILDERFARGEIDAEEYQQRRDLLRSG